jgi:hypothetical protein
MKYFLFLVCIVLLMPACQKDDPVEEPAVPLTAASLIGKWELRSGSGNRANCCNYAPGNGNILVFDGSGYEKYENNMLVKKGSYTVIADTTVGESTCLVIPKGSFISRIVYDSNLTNTKKFIEIKKGKLAFISGCYAVDAGYSETYDPIK